MRAQTDPRAGTVTAARSKALFATLVAALMAIGLLVPATPAQAAPTLGEQAAAYARTYLLGKPYDGSGRTTLAFNCSGSTYLAWSSVAPGHVQPGSSASQYNGTGERIWLGRGNTINGASLLPGDLLFWSTTGNPEDIYHVAIYLGNDEILQTNVGRLSWIGHVNNDRNTRMPYAIRPTGPETVPPVMSDIQFGFEDGQLVVTGSVTDPDDPTARVDVQVEDRYYPNGNMSRQYGEARAAVGGTFKVKVDLRGGGTHDVIIRARDVESRNYVQMGFPHKLGVGPGLRATTQTTWGEFAEFAHRANGAPPTAAGEFNGLPYGVALKWLQSSGAAGGPVDANAAPSRAQAITTLYKLAGEPPVSLPGSPTFSDVGSGHAAYRAVEWFAQRGLRSALGLSHNAGLDPNKALTRGDAVAMLYLAAGSPDAGEVPPGRFLWDVDNDHRLYDAAMWALVQGVLWDPFHDVPAGAPLASEIRWVATSGVATGYDDGSYRPDSRVSRQAMAAFIYRLAGEPDFTAPATPSFPDVPTSSAFYKQIEWLASTGLTGGYDDGTFRPSGSVSRQAMAAFLARMAGADTTGLVPSFPDVHPEHPMAAEITWLASTGITGGYADGGFRPGAPVSRRAMAAFLYRYDALFGG